MQFDTISLLYSKKKIEGKKKKKKKKSNDNNKNKNRFQNKEKKNETKKCKEVYDYESENSYRSDWIRWKFTNLVWTPF